MVISTPFALCLCSNAGGSEIMNIAIKQAREDMKQMCSGLVSSWFDSFSRVVWSKVFDVETNQPMDKHIKRQIEQLLRYNDQLGRYYDVCFRANFIIVI